MMKQPLPRESKKENTMPIDTPPSDGFDPKPFRKDLDVPELTKEQKDEVLRAIYHILMKFVDIGLGVDGIQLAREKSLDSARESGKSVVDINFKNAAKDTMKDPSDDGRKEAS